MVTIKLLTTDGRDPDNSEGKPPDRHCREESWWKNTGKPKDALGMNELVLSETRSYINGTLETDIKVTGAAYLVQTVAFLSWREHFHLSVPEP